MNIDKSFSSLAYVLLTNKKNAKVVKVALQQNGLLHKLYRMSKVDVESLCYFQPSSISLDVAPASSTSDLWPDCIAIPIYKEYKDILNSQWIGNDGNASNITEESDKGDKMPSKTLFSDEVSKLIIGMAQQMCPYSTSVLGNAKKLITSMPRSDDDGSESLNFVQTILHQVLMDFINMFNTDGQIPSKNLSSRLKTKISEQSNNITCPPKLEVMGDCRTLVIPCRALNLNSNLKDDNPCFHKLMTSIASEFNLTKCQPDDLNNDGENIKSITKSEDAYLSGMEASDVIRDLMINLWKMLAQAHRSKRVVRRGEIDPNSKVRESGHSIIWMACENHQEESGPGCKGWITITEQGIKQSFDLTKVMFSRGNISEKIRFGKLVKEDELILDMYAGIGYYTLPALVIGKAKHVYCCEWNPHAASFIRFNLKQNKVYNRANVLEGDSRVRLVEEDILRLDFDRVSLGLLPSSEGGWETAVRALNDAKGGWLHIHGNVPSHERDDWALWVCHQLSIVYYKIYPQKDSDHVHVLCHHIERVKSFAPKVDHFVLDIFVGPILPVELGLELGGKQIGIINQNGNFVECGVELPPPSCALGNGVLDQEWMM